MVRYLHLCQMRGRGRAEPRFDEVTGTSHRNASKLAARYVTQRSLSNPWYTCTVCLKKRKTKYLSVSASMAHKLTKSDDLMRSGASRPMMSNTDPQSC